MVPPPSTRITRRAHSVTHTHTHLQAEQEEAVEEAAAAEEEGSDEEEYIYNPLKLPLGWDGKPIPYWLYKLHGLNQVRRPKQVETWGGGDGVCVR